MGAILLVGLAATLFPARAQAQDVDQRLEAVRELILHAQFAEALTEGRALLAEEGLDARQRNAALEAVAVVLLAHQQHRGEAEETLARLYSRDPEHRLILRDTGPNVIAAFDRAREQRPAPVEVGIENLVPEALERRGAPTIEIALGENADAVDELRLSYRQGDESGFSRVVMTIAEGGTVARARIPAVDGNDPYDVEFFVTAHAPSRAIIGRLGTTSEPLSVHVPAGATTSGASGGPLGIGGDGGAVDEAEDSGILSKWWFWTLTGAVLIGVGVAVAVAVASSGQTAPDGTLGSGVLPLLSF